MLCLKWIYWNKGNVLTSTIVFCLNLHKKVINSCSRRIMETIWITLLYRKFNYEHVYENQACRAWTCFPEFGVIFMHMLYTCYTTHKRNRMSENHMFLWGIPDWSFPSLRISRLYDCQRVERNTWLHLQRIVIPTALCGICQRFLVKTVKILLWAYTRASSMV